MAGEDELTTKRLVLIGDNGAQTVIDANGIALDGGPGRGRIELSFDQDGAPLVALYSSDGSAWVGLRASDDGAGVSVKMPDRQSALVSSGLTVGDNPRLKLSEHGVSLEGADGENLFSLPFASGTIAV